ncbi:glycosyltransferase family 2 protein [Flavobacterium sp. 3HN19-14]|uniref:glycosyltransferase family 2 protein n=1 Tax=Flavobacterium sp. 3HN19-14 TaxID=3448133 RepID=UPI003EDF226F
MLSIVIPTYNYNIFPLVSRLKKLAEEAEIVFEIITIDDASERFLNENNAINSLENCSYEILEKNIGRSAIRNLLSRKAQYGNLLFLDADTFPAHDDFITKYLGYINSDAQIVYGGIIYQKEQPSKTQLLRWVYGISRESLPAKERNKAPYLSFLTLNFLIRKSVFEKVTFNEEIPNSRHEDTLFSFELMQQHIKMVHIDNPVYHHGLESSAVFLEKSEEALDNLKFLTDNRLIDTDYVRIGKLQQRFSKLHLDKLMSRFYKWTKPMLLKNILGEKPSLLIFDIYRLGYLCSIKKH